MKQRWTCKQFSTPRTKRSNRELCRKCSILTWISCLLQTIRLLYIKACRNNNQDAIPITIQEYHSISKWMIVATVVASIESTMKKNRTVLKIRPTSITFKKSKRKVNQTKSHKMKLKRSHLQTNSRKICMNTINQMKKSNKIISKNKVNKIKINNRRKRKRKIKNCHRWLTKNKYRHLDLILVILWLCWEKYSNVWMLKSWKRKTWF